MQKRYLILGGAGQVGFSIVLTLIKDGQKDFIIHGLTKKEILARKIELHPIIKKGDLRVRFVWGNLFSPIQLKDTPVNELIKFSQNRKLMINYLKNKSSKGYISVLVDKYKPDVLINSINYATYIGYQMKTRERMDNYLNLIKNKKAAKNVYAEMIEKNLISRADIYILKWYSDLYKIFNTIKLKYIEVSTTGFGGMGYNLLWTHGEPNQHSASDELISKAMTAGMSHQLSWNLYNTPGVDINVIVPSALIAWNSISNNIITRGGKNLKRVLNVPASKLKNAKNIFQLINKSRKLITKENVVQLGIDSGENSFFGAEEFKAISAVGQMEMVTKEEVAIAVLDSAKNINKNNILYFLDKASLTPSNQFEANRKKALDIINKSLLKKNSIAFGNLGPYITKLSFELFLISKVMKRLNDVKNNSSVKILEKIEKELINNKKLRNYILSLGIPILFSDGNTCYLPPSPILPTNNEANNYKINKKNIDTWASTGWIDLRNKNISTWKKRLELVIKDASKNNKRKKLNLINSRNIKLNKQIDVGETLACILSLEGGGRKK